MHTHGLRAHQQAHARHQRMRLRFQHAGNMLHAGRVIEKWKKQQDVPKPTPTLSSMKKSKSTGSGSARRSRSMRSHRSLSLHAKLRESWIKLDKWLPIIHPTTRYKAL
eukprot:353436-Chlamydomonas_euryale.AAC.18